MGNNVGAYIIDIRQFLLLPQLNFELLKETPWKFLVILLRPIFLFVPMSSVHSFEYYFRRIFKFGPIETPADPPRIQKLRIL